MHVANMYIIAIPATAIRLTFLVTSGIFFQPVDYVCISDNYWLGKKKPCITYGLR